MKRIVLPLIFTVCGTAAAFATRPNADTELSAARQALKEYRLDDAREHYDEYERLIKRRRRATIPPEVEEERSRLVMMENMMERVERITVIDSLSVDSVMFFEAYGLSPEAGRLVRGQTARVPDADMVFVTQNNSQMIFAQPDTGGVYTLMAADMLDDGSVEPAHPLPGADLGDGGNARWPFLLSDGMTLYYASDGEGSVGGYDIFMTRRDDEGEYLQPQNVGMPYNSPDNDFMLAIDESTGTGWWATDRNHVPGRLTVYVFIPSDNRVNVPVDDPNLAALARLSDTSLTREPGKDYTRRQPESAAKAAKAPVAPFPLAIGGTGRVYNSLADFRNTEARQSMAMAVNARVQIDTLTQRLAALRADYAKGDRSQSSLILNLESQLDDARSALNDYINEAIAAETR